MDTVRPGVVEWEKVVMKPKNVYNKIANCNYAVALAKDPKAFKFSVVGIQGKDLSDGNAKLILAITWQLMRYHVIRFLSNLSSGEGGKQLEEKDVIEWANAKVGDAAPPIGSLKDASLGSGRFLLALLRAVEPRSVDSAQVKEGATAEEKMLNAKYAISCARRVGCMVFLLWEDIVEVKPKMLLVFVGTLMARSQGK